MSNYKQIYIPQGGNLDTTQSNKNNGSDKKKKENTEGGVHGNLRCT